MNGGEFPAYEFLLKGEGPGKGHVRRILAARRSKGETLFRVDRKLIYVMTFSPDGKRLEGKSTE
jgi:hypothetical protein